MDYNRNPSPQYPQYPPYPPPAYQIPPAYYAPKNPWNKPIRRNSNIVGVGLLVLTLLSFFLYPGFLWLEQSFVARLGIKSPQILSLIEQLRSLLLYALMFIIPLVIMRPWIGIPAKVAFPMKRPRATIAFPAVLFCLGVAIVGMFTSSIVSNFVQIVFGLEQINPPTVYPIGVASTIVYFIHMTFAPAFLEELMFRGVIMQSLRRFGDFFAVVCTSILFSLIHANMEQSVSVFFVGLAIGFFVVRTGSLRAGMLIHFMHNAILTVLELCTRSYSETAQNLVSWLLVAVYILLGLVGFAFLQHFHSGSFKLKKGEYPVAEGKKYSLVFTSPVMIIYLIITMIIVLIQLN